MPVKQQPSDGDDEDADADEQPVQGAHHPRQVALFGFFGLVGQAGSIGLCPHMGEHGVTLARDNKAAGEQLAALPFGDFVRLTGDQGLVHLDTAGDHFGIGRNLVAGGEDDQVILYQVAGGDGAFDSISNHLGPWGREEGEGVQFFLGMELLDDADGSVGGHHQEENQLSERAHRDQKTGDDIEDDVKEGEEILQDNPLHRFGGRFWRGVDLASLDPFSNLGGGEARRSLSGGAGGLVQCRHRRASDFWEFGKQKPEAQGTWPIRPPVRVTKGSILFFVRNNKE